MAEIAVRQGNLSGSQKHLETASTWIVHAGSVEHLCRLHLVRARAARLAGDLEGAGRAVAEGLHLAAQCGFGLWHVELLCVQAELQSNTDAAAEHLAREALRRASAQNCQFVWGAAEAGHLLGQMLAVQQRCDEARAILRQTLTLRAQIHDLRGQDTERLLASLR